jgi:branched-chain amino acid transport system substrate-binding protein
MLLQLRGVRFLPSGENDRAAGLVLVVKDGDPQLVAPREVASTKALYPKPPWTATPKR